MPSVSSRSWLNREPMTAAALKRALGRRVQAVDARGDGGLQRGWHADLGSVGRRHVGAAVARAAHRARPVRAPSPRRKTDYRRPARRSWWPTRRPRGRGPSSSVTSAAVSESLSGARAML